MSFVRLRKLMEILQEKWRRQFSDPASPLSQTVALSHTAPAPPPTTVTYFMDSPYIDYAEYDKSRF
jgi:hypothetical protein